MTNLAIPGLDQQVGAWVAERSLSPAEVDCATAVMLKILDEKCKMAAAEKVVMQALYLACRQQPCDHLTPVMHNLIEYALQLKEMGSLDESLRLFIYEQRVLAETMISRPVMKAFKARLRAEGLFVCIEGIELDLAGDDIDART